MADNIEQNDLSNKENASEDIYTLSVDNHRAEVDYKEAVDFLLHYYQYEHFALTPWCSIDNTMIRKICYLLIFHTHSGEFCECYPRPRDNMLAACNILSAIAFNMDNILYNENVVVYLINALNQTPMAVSYEHTGIRNALSNPKFGSHVQDFHCATDFHCYMVWRDTELSHGRLFFAYCIWLKFVTQHYTDMYKRYVNYLLHTGQLTKYGVFVQITTMANILFFHEESIAYWKYSFMNTVIPLEVQFFLNNCYSYLPSLYSILRTRLFGNDNFRIFRSLADNNSYYDALLDGDAIISERLRQHDWWRSAYGVVRDFSSITANESLMSIKDCWTEYNDRIKKENAKEKRKFKRRGVTESTEKNSTRSAHSVIRF